MSCRVRTLKDTPLCRQVPSSAGSDSSSACTRGSQASLYARLNGIVGAPHGTQRQIRAQTTSVPSDLDAARSQEVNGEPTEDRYEAEAARRCQALQYQTNRRDDSRRRRLVGLFHARASIVAGAAGAAGAAGISFGLRRRRPHAVRFVVIRRRGR